MTTEDRDTRVAQILAEAREEALVATTWTCSMDSEGRVRYVTVSTPWWNQFTIGWIAGLICFVVLDWLFS